MANPKDPHAESLRRHAPDHTLNDQQWADLEDGFRESAEQAAQNEAAAKPKAPAKPADDGG